MFPSDDVDADYQLNILGGTSGLFTIFLINSLPQAITQSDVLTTPAGNPFGAVGAQQFANSDFFTDANGDRFPSTWSAGFRGTFYGSRQWPVRNPVRYQQADILPGQSLVTISVE
ncbi:MAG: hypothetical protein R3D89_12170 [Sphingomonadaceae bacterium]